MVCRPGRLLPLVFLLAALPAPLRAHPHAAPTLWIDVTIADEAVTFSLTGLREILHPRLGLAADRRGALPAELQAQAKAGARAWLRDPPVVTVDGAAAPFSVASLGPTDGVPELERAEYLRVVLRYPCDQPPGRVAIVWRLYQGADWLGEPQVPLSIVHGDDITIRALVVEEPGFTWHAPVRPPERPDRGVAPVGEPAPSGPSVPPLTLACGLVALLLVRWPRRASRGARATAFVVLLAAGGAAWPWQVRVPLAPSVEVPDGEEAGRILSTLLDNVYRAFGAQGESRTYDLLAASVDRSLIDELYVDVRESLILREAGGAVCRVREVTHLGGTMEPPDGEADAPRFTTTWRWKVRSDVTHWGHTHERITLQEARFVVRHNGRSWKIRRYDVLQQERVEVDGGEDPRDALGRIR